MQPKNRCLSSNEKSLRMRIYHLMLSASHAASGLQKEKSELINLHFRAVKVKKLPIYQ